MSVEAPPDPFVELLLRFYHEAAPFYDDWADGVHRKAAARVVQLAAVQPGELVVDAGCGTGLVANALAAGLRSGGGVVGADLSPAMLAVAQANCPAGAPVTFGPGVVENLMLRNETVDVVVLGLVLSYTVNPLAVLLEARRVLRPGGRLVVSEYQPSLRTEVDEIFQAELRDLAEVVLRVPDPRATPRLLGEPRALRGLLSEAGYGDIRTSSMVVGNHTEDAHAFVEVMRYESPRTHALLQVMGPGARERLERRLSAAVRFSHDNDGFRYHRPISFATARRD